MMWRALSRLIVVRLALLVTITAAGPAGVASSWHALSSVEHRLPTRPSDHRAATLESGALPPSVVTHCAACQFGATLRAWTPALATSSLAPVASTHDVLRPTVTTLRDQPADANAGRAPPLAC